MRYFVLGHSPQPRVPLHAQSLAFLELVLNIRRKQPARHEFDHDFDFLITTGRGGHGIRAPLVCAWHKQIDVLPGLKGDCLWFDQPQLNPSDVVREFSNPLNFSLVFLNRGACVENLRESLAQDLDLGAIPRNDGLLRDLQGEGFLVKTVGYRACPDW